MCKLSLKKLILSFSVEQGTPVGCFPRPDVLNAILELIKDALLWKLDDPVYIGLSHTSLADSKFFLFSRLCQSTHQENQQSK
jgi:hypothetical protein